MVHHTRKLYLNTHVQVNLDELDEDGAVIIVDYKMRILPCSARETKSQFFGKRGWSLHSSLVYTKDANNNKLNVQVFDHCSDDTGQDAWFTASSLHTVFKNLDPKPKWITVMSDNGPHYHCTELMLIIGQWKDWYDIVPQKWIFLEAGEAKTLIDSHHAQVIILLALFYLPFSLQFFLIFCCFGLSLSFLYSFFALIFPFHSIFFHF